MQSRLPVRSRRIDQRLLQPPAVLTLVIMSVLCGLTFGLTTPNAQSIVSTHRVATADITILNTAFSPSTLSIPIGTTVRWINRASSSHRVISDSSVEHPELASLFSATASVPNSVYEFKFGYRGTYQYHDQLNPAVSGTITVQ